MSFRFLATTLALGTFLLTFAIASWHDGLGPFRRSALVDQGLASASIAVSQLPAPAAARPAPVTEPPPAPAPPSVDSSPAEARESIDEAVPITVVMGRDPVRRVRTLKLVNRMADTLRVSVTAQNPATGGQSQVELSIAAHETADASQAGLYFSPGDEVIVHSPPFRDVVVGR